MTGRTRWIAAAAALALGLPAAAAVKTKPLEYAQGKTKLQGFVAWDDAAKEQRPGVLVVHEWWGHNEHARAQAKRLAEAGFVAFALDMYGKGKVATHPKDAQAFMQEATKDAGVVKARFDAALAALKKQKGVDPARIAAVGYCFGGTVALSMARAGEDLDAVAALHAGLAPVGPPAEPGKVKAKVIVFTGGSDPMVPAEQVQKFEEEMKAAGVDAKVVTFPEAKHAFTNPAADTKGMEALKYDPQADQESFEQLVEFLRGALGGTT
jgi:dienelactone hydrolase